MGWAAAVRWGTSMVQRVARSGTRAKPCIRDEVMWPGLSPSKPYLPWPQLTVNFHRPRPDR
jgi:hypothetical protein